MATRGKKVKTARNSAAVLPIQELPEPTAILGDMGACEFQRLAKILHARGTLERVDPGVITEAARVFGRLSKAYADDDTKVINQLTTQRRGLLRELGLTLQPSRSVVKTIAKDQTQDDPIAGKIKLHG